jgi:hypothetical protein
VGGVVAAVLIRTEAEVDRTFRLPMGQDELIKEMTS